MRDREKLSQEQLAEIAGMNQNAISRLENPFYGRPTITTLKRIAAVLDVALVVRFVPFSRLVDWVSGTPFVDSGLSMESTAVPSFGQEDQTVFALGGIPHNVNVAAQISSVRMVKAGNTTGTEIAVGAAPMRATEAGEMSQRQAAAGE
jgi:transcriptional regulator with XRE-family HTH domain